MDKKIRAKKRFGQNFLQDEEVLKQIVSIAGVTKEDTILEIGPGTGNLTTYLLAQAADVVAIEIDTDLVAYLKKRFLDVPHFTLLQADILNLQLENISQIKQAKHLKVVANLPYYITTPIIMLFLEGSLTYESLTVMVQKEVGQRMVGKPNTGDYGALSIAVQYYTDPHLSIEVPASCFSPVPKVDSCVVHMKRKPYRLPQSEERGVFDIVKAAFAQRRKTLVNGLSHDGRWGDKETIRNVILSLGWKETIRGECLSLEDYISLQRALAKRG